MDTFVPEPTFIEIPFGIATPRISRTLQAFHELLNYRIRAMKIDKRKIRQVE